VQRVAAGRSWLADAPETEPIPGDLAADLAARDVAAAPAPIIPTPIARQDPPRVTASDVRTRRAPRPALDEKDAETAYAAAEELMRSGSATAARRALLDFVTANPHDPRAELALLDLARLALAAGHPIEARRYV